MRSKLEKNLEREVLADLAFQGFQTVKVGFDGWPDRLVLLGNGRHIWFELKTGTGLRKAQIIRLAQLERDGDKVYVIRDEIEAERALEDAIRTL